MTIPYLFMHKTMTNGHKYVRISGGFA